VTGGPRKGPAEAPVVRPPPPVVSARLSDAAADAAARAVCRLLDGGTLRIYAGVLPPSTDSPVPERPLGEIAFASPAFGAPREGIAQAREFPAEGLILEDGVPGWYRCSAADGTPVFDGVAGPQDSGAGLELSHTRFQAGASLRLRGFTYVAAKG